MWGAGVPVPIPRFARSVARQTWECEQMDPETHPVDDPVPTEDGPEVDESEGQPT